MRKSIYILTITFLIYGKGFASSIDFFTVFEANSIEKLFNSDYNATCQIKEKNKISFNNDICKILSNECSNSKFLMNQESIKCNHYTKVSNSLEEMKMSGISSMHYRPYFNITYQIKGKNRISFNNDFCKILSNESSSPKFLMNQKSIKCKHFNKNSNSLQEMKYLNIINNYYPSVSNCETISYKKFEETRLAYSSGVKLNFERSENINLEEHIFQLIDPNYFRGLGIRIKI